MSRRRVGKRKYDADSTEFWTMETGFGRPDPVVDLAISSSGDLYLAGLYMRSRKTADRRCKLRRPLPRLQRTAPLSGSGSFRLARR